MINVKTLIEQLNSMIEQGFLSEDDIVVLLGTGDKKSGYISSLTMPKVIPNFETDEKGYYHLGFCSEDNIAGGWIPTSKETKCPH